MGPRMASTSGSLVIGLAMVFSLAWFMGSIAKKKNRNPVEWGALAFIPGLNIIFLILLLSRSELKPKVKNQLLQDDHQEKDASNDLPNRKYLNKAIFYYGFLWFGVIVTWCFSIFGSTQLNAKTNGFDQINGELITFVLAFTIIGITYYTLLIEIIAKYRMNTLFLIPFLFIPIPYVRPDLIIITVFLLSKTDDIKFIVKNYKRLSG